MRFIASSVFVIGLFISLPQVTNADFTTDDFITTWDTENTGTSASNQITIPGTGAGYSYSIYWESLSSSTATGTIATSTSASQTITFPEPGEYKVAIKGTYPRIYFNNGGDKLKILTVEQWGSIAWTSMAAAFYGCANLTIPATDAPNLSGVTDMSHMFANATSFNNPVNHWDVSNVTSMLRMYWGATSFNQPVSNWDVSKVISMRDLFAGTSFNQPVNNWNTSSTTNMTAVFRQTPFNQPLDNWDTSNVTSMYTMFAYNSAFDQDLSSWNIESIQDNSNRGAINTIDGLTNLFLNSSLSTANLDATLASWASQSVNSDIRFNLGLKTYSTTGQTALNTLENTYNWIITEQYQAEYQEGDDYTLSGTTTQSPINLNGTTTAVEVIPDERCEFISWSDGNTNNPRTDTLTDNLTVSTNVECRNPTTSTNVKARADKLEAMGNQAKAEALRQQYHLTPNSTLHTAIINIKTLTTNPTITNNPQTRQQLISLLQQLVQILRGMAGESN